MNGKSKCKILKDIRRQIAQDNDIEFVTSECKYQGDCSGTCPKCESEVRYLEQELAKRQAAGKAIAVAGIAAALVVGAAGCGMDTNTTDGDIEPSASTSQTDPTQTDPLQDPGEVVMGEPTDPTTPTIEPTHTLITGDIVIPDYTEPDLAGFLEPDDDYILPAGVPVLDEDYTLPAGALPPEDYYQPDTDNAP